MLHIYFLQNTRAKNKRLWFVSLILVLLSIYVMQQFDFSLKNELTPYGIGSFELAKDISKSIQIIQLWKGNGVMAIAGLSLGFDFVFIFTYTSFLSLSVFLLSKRKLRNNISYLGKILIWLLFLAGLLDVIENVSLIKLVLGSTQQNWAILAYYTAIPKFSIILISIIYLVLNLLFLLFHFISKKDSY